MEAKWARLAFVDEASIAVYEEETIRPSCVGLLGDVIQSVDHCGKFDPQFTHATVGDIEAFIEVAGARKDDVVLHVALHLPDITGVSFEDVDGVERDVVPVLLKQLVEGRNLPPEGRSSVAAEDEDDGLLSPERREANVTSLVLGRQIEVRNFLADVDGTLSSTRP